MIVIEGRRRFYKRILMEIVAVDVLRLLSFYQTEIEIES